jgi:alpha-tubulin suppressor-like RCC1 family protein
MKTTRTLIRFLLILLSSEVLGAVSSLGQVVEWGINVGGGATGVPFPQYYYSTSVVAIAGWVLTNAVAVAGGMSHGLALKADSTVVGWGWNATGQATGSASSEPDSTNGPVKIGVRLLSNVTSVAAGRDFSMALKGDGTVVAWGENRFGQTSVPTGLSNVIAIAAGYSHSLALKKDGTIASWGQGNPPPKGLSNVVAIAAGGESGRNLALKSDGTVADWPVRSVRYDSTVPVGLSNVVAIAAGSGHSLALKRDGTIVGWGETGASPAGLNNVVSIAAGNDYSVALKSDGTVVAWGNDSFHQTDVPAGLSNVVAIAAGNNFCLAITTNSAVAEKFRH